MEGITWYVTTAPLSESFTNPDVPQNLLKKMFFLITSPLFYIFSGLDNAVLLCLINVLGCWHIYSTRVAVLQRYLKYKILILWQKRALLTSHESSAYLVMSNFIKKVEVSWIDSLCLPLFLFSHFPPGLMSNLKLQCRAELTSTCHTPVAVPQRPHMADSSISLFPSPCGRVC